jgi:hypothetical protein
MTEERYLPFARPRALALVGAGVLVGLVSGVLMALVAMVHCWAVGLGFWLPMKLVSGVYMGVHALLGNGGVVVVGTLTHSLTAIGWGIVFGAITRGSLDPRLAATVGVAFGVAVWVIMTYLVLPWANPTMLVRAQLAMGWFVFYHLMYGLSLGFSPAVARRLESWYARMDPDPAPMTA